jgi:hypothetical protein
MGIHQTLIGLVRCHLGGASPDPARLAREVQARGREALGLLERGLATYGATDPGDSPVR